MYLKMLSEAIAEKKGETPERQIECTIDIRADAHLPESYIDDINQRIDIYHKIAAIRNKTDASDVLDELIDRFGDPPASVENLVGVAVSKMIFAQNGFYEIRQQVNSLLFYPLALEEATVKLLMKTFGNRVTMTAGAKPYITVKIKPGTAAVDTLQEVSAALSGENAASRP